MKNECPLLSGINTPDDLRRLPVEDLPQVCGEIRKFLIDTLSRNPGHFASSMGTVELTVALHYVFDTPRDRIVWDVGHQAYSHKLLTGRRDRFDTLRKLGGLSGFPNPAESEYDSFIAGHASNSISAALGMTVASKLSGEPRRNVVAVIGDASISGGLAFEGLNNASLSSSNLLIILNDNDMAIDQNVGALNEYMTRINTSKSYNHFRYKVYHFLKKLHLIDEQHRGLILRFNNSIKALLTRQQNIFEGLDIRYFGPYDGHDVVRIVRALNDIKDMEGPRLLHLRTRKGKGYKPAEDDPVTWHAPGRFDPATGVRVVESAAGRPPKYQDVFGHTIIELARQNPKIVGVTAAMPTGCSLSYMLEEMPRRAFDVGIAEEHAVTFSGGMAKDGLIPFCCIYSTFLQRAYDEIIHDVALQRLPVVFCIDRAGLVGDDGVTHHGVFDMAYLGSIPGIVVSSPMNEHYLRHLMYTAQSGKYGPFAIRYPRGNGVLVDWQCPMHELPVGKGRKLCDGDSVAVLSIGPIGNDVQAVISELGDDGRHVAHYDMIFLNPIDEEILQEVGSRFAHVITVEDGLVRGGLGSAVIEWFNDHGMSVGVKRIGVPDRFIAQGTIAQLRKECGMDNASIKKYILEILKKSDK
ncbi:MAG TPA: 1-deoxy-D-xylulose-5-phosphate synthase [Candidatus Avimuribaculum pullicola]|nr:1-deoxy-D-xylulose-5-phosphate synthase [Candidatus Avimuribaculum pullicola]